MMGGREEDVTHTCTHTHTHTHAHTPKAGLLVVLGGGGFFSVSGGACGLGGGGFTGFFFLLLSSFCHGASSASAAPLPSPPPSCTHTHTHTHTESNQVVNMLPLLHGGVGTQSGWGHDLTWFCRLDREGGLMEPTGLWARPLTAELSNWSVSGTPKSGEGDIIIGDSHYHTGYSAV